MQSAPILKKHPFESRGGRCLYKTIGVTLFVIGLIMISIGLPFLLGYSTNELLKYPLYLGLLITVLFTPGRKITRRKN